MYCTHCGSEIDDKAVVCPNCGVATANAVVKDKSKIAAGLLGIFLGGLGIHKFYLGYKKEGIIMLVVSLVGIFLTLGIATSAIGIIGVIEGIVYLVKSDEEFEQTYVKGYHGWF
ncbi:MAG: zinc ribbon domain-containing protein [Clostridia bacterium]|nr:zinc ribbon domain-containing protein [Clostridia bacterium]